MLKRILRLLPFASQAKALIRDLVIDPQRETLLDVLSTFPSFAPNSAGSYADKVPLTINALNESFPALTALLRVIDAPVVQCRPIETFAVTAAECDAAASLKMFLDRYGSDKAGYHNYHHLYGAILSGRRFVRAVLEVGIGSNNIDVVSNMGAAGNPGASLRAFRDFLGDAHIYGCDIDRGILFDEERISTFFVDQTNPASFDALALELPVELDLVIDDGLHSPRANIETLCFGLSRLRVGGWVVVEDIVADALPIWQVIGALMCASHEVHLLQARAGLVFAVKRLR